MKVKVSFLTPFPSKRISDFWPEFGQHGKEKTTIADLMRHEVRQRQKVHVMPVTFLYLGRTSQRRTNGR